MGLSDMADETLAFAQARLVNRFLVQTLRGKKLQLSGSAHQID